MISGNFTNPCFPSGYEEVIDGARYIGTSNYTECVATITPLINVTAPCKWETCGMRGYYMPDIITAPPSSRWFVSRGLGRPFTHRPWVAVARVQSTPG